MTSWRNWPRELETNAGGETLQRTAVIVSRTFSARLLPLNYDRILRTGEATGLSLQALFWIHVGMLEWSPLRSTFQNPGWTAFFQIFYTSAHVDNSNTFCRSFQMWRTWEKPWRGSSAEVRGAEFGWETIHVFPGVRRFLPKKLQCIWRFSCLGNILIVFSRLLHFEDIHDHCDMSRTEWPSDFRSSVTSNNHFSTWPQELWNLGLSGTLWKSLKIYLTVASFICFFFGQGPTILSSIAINLNSCAAKPLNTGLVLSLIRKYRGALEAAHVRAETENVRNPGSLGLPKKAPLLVILRCQTVSVATLTGFGINSTINNETL